MNTFKVGDKVKIVKKFDGDSSGISWVTGMNPTLGLEGEVLDVYDNHGTIQYLVRSHSDEWWYLKESLELAKDVTVDLPKFTNREAFDNLQLKKGDTIKICGKAKSNSRGWCNSWIKAMDRYVGQTFTLESTPEYADSGLHILGTSVRWPFFVLEKVTAEQKQSVRPTTKFKAGDKVRVVKNTSHGFEAGTIGTVSRVVRRPSSESDTQYEYDIICPPQSFPYIHPESDLELHTEMCPKPEKKDKYITSSDYERISVKSAKKTGSKMVVDVEVMPKTSVQSIIVNSTIVDTTLHLNPYLLLG